MDSALNGCTALVTGAAARLGAALAVALAERGCAVAVHYGSNREGAEQVVERIRGLGMRAVAFSGDLANVETPGRLAEAVLAEFGGLDILVNSASLWVSPESISAKYDLRQESAENWERTLAVNARAPFFLMQRLVPALERSGKGSILNILDDSVSEPYLNRAAHSISKSALAAATRVAAGSLRGKVRVNALECGDILPPDAMGEAERSRRSWAGVELFVAAALAVLEDSGKHGEVIWVGEISA